jgi:hypothetical protein
MQKDWKWDSLELLEKSLTNMEEWVKKASDIMKTYDEKFGTPTLSDPTGSGTWNPGGNGWSTPPKTGNPQDEKTESPIEVQRFVKKEGKPWGFEAVAGMESLKEELKDSFIKPLRFKFLIEKLKREEALQAELPEDQKLEKRWTYSRVKKRNTSSWADSTLSMKSIKSLSQRECSFMDLLEREKHLSQKNLPKNSDVVLSRKISENSDHHTSTRRPKISKIFSMPPRKPQKMNQ